MAYPERIGNEDPEPTIEETKLTIDLSLSEILTDAMRIEEWDLETALLYIRVAYLKGREDAANQILESLREASEASPGMNDAC